MKTFKTMTLSLLVLGLLALPAMAQMPGGPGGQGGHGNGPHAAFSQLTPEKQAAVKAIFEKHQPKLTQLQDQMWAKNLELKSLVNSGKADAKNIQALTGDISKLRAQLFEERKALHAEIEKETGLSTGGGMHGMMGGMMGGCGGKAGKGGMGGGMGGMGGGCGGCPMMGGGF